MNRTAKELIERMGLTPLAEGGWFKLCGRSGVVLPEGAAGCGGVRDSCSYIYYLLPKDEISRWHRLNASEVWTWHAGGSLLMTLGGDETLPRAGETMALGSKPERGEQFSVMVPAGQWQTSRITEGDFVLVSCVVAPSYDDADCLLPEKPLSNEIYPEKGEVDHET